MNGRRDLAISLLLASLTLLPFAGVVHNAFVEFDDGDYVTENRNVRTGLTREGVLWALGTTHAANWHPLTWISHMLDVEVHGMDPAGHHATSLVLHVVNAVLLYLALARATAAPWRSAFVAAFFAVHPLHVESVAWVSERKDVLSTSFGLIAMIAYVAHARRPRVSVYLLSLASYALGLMAKPMLVTLPFVFVLLDHWPLARLRLPAPHGTEKRRPTRHTGLHATEAQGLGRLLLEKAPFLVLAAASSGLTLWAQQRAGAVESWENLPLESRLANAPVAYVAYLVKTLWPTRLACLYPHPAYLGAELSLPRVALATLTLVLVTALALREGRRRPYVAVGWFWYLGTLVPVIGIVQVGLQSFADRYTYLPLVGIFTAAVWSAVDLSPRWRGRNAALAALGAVALVLCALVTRAQVRTWSTSAVLFDHALAVTSDNYPAHNNVGVHLAKQGRVDEAIGHFQAALRINPHYDAAHTNLGTALALQGRLREAVELLTRAVELRPDSAKAHQNLAAALLDQGRPDEASGHFREALRIQPAYVKARTSLALTLARLGRPEEAIRHLAEAIRLEPDSATPHANLGLLLADLGRTREAEKSLREALRLEPDRIEVLERLSWVLATAQPPDPADAVRLAERAVALGGRRRTQGLHALAAAYAASSRFDDALRADGDALALARSSGDDVLALEIERSLKRHAAGPSAGPAPDGPGRRVR